MLPPSACALSFLHAMSYNDGNPLSQLTQDLLGDNNIDSREGLQRVLDGEFTDMSCVFSV